MPSMLLERARAHAGVLEEQLAIVTSREVSVFGFVTLLFLSVLPSAEETQQRHLEG